MTDAGGARLRGAVRSLLLIITMCVTLALLLVASGVAIWAWVIGPALGPHPTVDGSSCSSWSGRCVLLSKERLAGYTGIMVPAGSSILDSGSLHGMKDAEAFGLICTGDPDGVLAQARAVGYSAGTRKVLPVRGPTIPLGKRETVLTRNDATAGKWQQVAVGSHCGGQKTRVLLTYFWNG